MKKQQKAAKTLGILIGIIWLCWNPTFLFLTMFDLGFNFLPQSNLRLTILIGNSTTA